MHLDAGQNVTVHVSYDNDMVPTSDSTNAFDQMVLGDGSANSVDQPVYRELVEAKTYNVQYILITGSRWKGPIGDCRIIVHTDKIGREKVRSVAPLPDAISDKEIIWHWRNFKPHADLRISLFDKRTLSSQIEKFRAACAKPPNDAKLVACLGLMYQLQGKPVDELMLFKDFLIAHPNAVFHKGMHRDENIVILLMISSWVRYGDSLGLQSESAKFASALKGPIEDYCKKGEFSAEYSRTSACDWQAWLDRNASK